MIYSLLFTKTFLSDLFVPSRTNRRPSRHRLPKAEPPLATGKEPSISSNLCYNALSAKSAERPQGADGRRSRGGTGEGRSRRQRPPAEDGRGARRTDSTKKTEATRRPLKRGRGRRHRPLPAGNGRDERRRSPRGGSGSIEPPTPSEAEGAPLLSRGEADEELAPLEAQMPFESAQSLDAGKAAAELPGQQRLPPDAHHVRQSLLGHSQRHPSRPESGTQVLFQEHHLRLCSFSTAW